MNAFWFSTLKRVHAIRGRVRWIFCYTESAPHNVRALIQSVENLTGVTQVSVNTRIASLTVCFDPERSDADTLQAQLLTLPAPRILPAASSPPREKPSLTGIVTTLSALAINRVVSPGVQMPLTLATSFPVFVSAWRDLLTEGISSHVLEALAVGISAQRRDHLAANTTAFMLALGDYLEDSIAHHSDDLLKRLLTPASNEVWVEKEGREVQMALSDVKVGDVVVAATGQVIPVDGTVLDGEASINESSMTGESVPQRKFRGDSVLSGTLVEEGRLRIYAEQVGEHTAAARIADYVEMSLHVKSQSQLQAARLADRLVPLVLGLAGTTFVLTGEWQRVAAVLQADYSCVLKLATPVAFKSAMYGAGRHGILVKGATALEKLAEADTFVFDKTGTLTAGLLEVTDCLSFDPAFTPDDLICLAASVEEHYFHPMALAVVSAAQQSGAAHRHFDHSEVEFIVAHGVASEIAGKRIVVGSRHFVEDDESVSFTAHRDRVESLYRDGKTLLYIGYDHHPVGVIALKDQIRANSAKTIRQLRALGVKKILLLTGDHKDRAAELAQELQLDDFHAELLPQEKAAIVENLRKAGARIAFVGDGVNDAPALAGAHVGISMQKGADLARISSDIALLEDDISLVATAKKVANRTMKLIHANYKMAVGLNTAILGGAAWGKLGSASSSVLHNGSTIAILLNALKAGRFARSD